MPVHAYLERLLLSTKSFKSDVKYMNFSAYFLISVCLPMHYSHLYLLTFSFKKFYYSEFNAIMLMIVAA